MFFKLLHSKFGCEVTNCFGTSNRSLLPVETYDAVVFNSYDLLGDFAVSIFYTFFQGMCCFWKPFDRFLLWGLGTRGMSTSCLNHLRLPPTLSMTTQYIRTRAEQTYKKANATGARSGTFGQNTRRDSCPSGANWGAFQKICLLTVLRGAFKIVFRKKLGIWPNQRTPSL